MWRRGTNSKNRPRKTGDQAMTLDVHTLFLVTIYVEAILGLLLLFVWAQNMALRAVCWWGFAHMVRLVSIGLFSMYGAVPNLISIDLANALLFTAFAVTWTGARVFDGRPVEPVYLVTGRCSLAPDCRLPILAEDVNLRALIASGIITGYTWLTAYEFWLGRDEPLVSRWPAIILLFTHGALFLLRTPAVAEPGQRQPVQQCVDDGAELRGPAPRHLGRVHPACDGEGAHRIASPHGCDGGSATRHRK
jgi:hypothetical protein